ncbi:MAG TPA: caspase family protein [Polyangia bacterium]|jgi:hypothetical protein
MIRRLALVAALLGAGTVATAGTTPSRPATRFAIVIGNNQPETAARPALRYADDDAVATHRLLTEAGVVSVLLTRLDADSRRFHAGVTPAGPPLWADLIAAIGRLAGQIRAAAARGEATELLVFYSGHGDVERGEGYLLLEDRRLTRSLLHELLARSPAGRNHVIIDACKSYYMVFDRGPGGQRQPYRGWFLDRRPAPHLARTGFVLSTSSDRESHEWERFQAGVFSHQVRSALRGAADADGDGRVTYAELGAFLTTANATIGNPRFRPDFLVQPPGRDLALEVLRWPSHTTALLLDDPRAGHVFVESPRGERLVDAHPAASQVVALHLPAERPLFVRRHDGRAEYTVSGAAPVRLAALTPEPVRVASRGALNLALEQLFAVPFGADRVAEFRRAWVAAQMMASPADEPRRRQALTLRLGAWTAVGAAAGGTALSLVALERYATGRDASQAERERRNAVIRPCTLAAGVLFGVAAAAGITWVAVRLWPADERAPRLAAVPTGDGAAVVVGGAW